MDMNFLNLTTPSDNEVSPALERINKIKEYGKKKEKEEYNSKHRAEIELCKALENLKELSTRILELVATANVCIINGLDISNFTKDPRPVLTLNISEKGLVNTVSLKNFDVWDLYVYPNSQIMFINNHGVRNSVGLLDIAVLKKFVEDFDSFEKCFYDYIDEVIK